MSATPPPPASHVPVLLSETFELLAPRAGETFVDLTAGRGGHAAEAAGRVGPDGRIALFDVDAGNLSVAAKRVRALGIEPLAWHESFVRAPGRLREEGVRADAVLADLGFSSNQMDDPARGLSFRSDGPLDMRFRTAGGALPPGRTATELLASIAEGELVTLIRRYGEDPFAPRIARTIVQARAEEPITTTGQLARLVVAAYGGRAGESRQHPATRTFMALRIAVNEELAALEALLEAIATGAAGAASGRSWLASGARIAVISFHSLEDRRVKRAFADMTRRGLARSLTGKPVGPGPREVEENSRARSARLRAVQITLGSTDAA